MKNTFEWYCKTVLFTVKFHVVDHVVQNVEKFRMLNTWEQPSSSNMIFKSRRGTDVHVNGIIDEWRKQRHFLIFMDGPSIDIKKCQCFIFCAWFHILGMKKHAQNILVVKVNSLCRRLIKLYAMDHSRFKAEKGRQSQSWRELCTQNF